MANIVEETVKECNRLSEDCLYTVSTVYIWLRVLRIAKVVFLILPLVLGGLSGWKGFSSSASQSGQEIAGLLGIVAGITSAVYAALKLDEIIGTYKRIAAELKKLQKRFRQAATIDSLRPEQDFLGVFTELRERMESTYDPVHTPPEWCFWYARWKIKKGIHRYDSDTQSPPQ
jgi:hypothetical protein